MVRGLDIFEESFREYEEKYMQIGEAAYQDLWRTFLLNKYKMEVRR